MRSKNTGELKAFSAIYRYGVDVIFGLAIKRHTSMVNQID